MDVEKYLEEHGKKILHDSEKIFIKEFLYPILGPDNLEYVQPQYPFIDSEGHMRNIDFAIVTDNAKVAFEINGETYHSEGIIASEQFDDNLYRQNEILQNGWKLLRFSYTQLLETRWRERVMESVKRVIRESCPELLLDNEIKPNIIQREVLKKLDYFRSIGWDKGLAIMPTGTGKTFLAALDSYEMFRSRCLFVVHKIDILTQSMDSFKKVWVDKKFGILTGDIKENVKNSDILFASKDSLYKTETLKQFEPTEFDYIIIDEVHHGQAPTYKPIFQYFTPQFMLGLTATPDRMDRKDILELFDYNKVCDYDINDAITRGFLVSYSYYGLQDNIDYTKIRHNGNRYNVTDLENNLIIDKRNQAIFDKYMEICEGDKAIGFCVSIKHAKRMADFFNKKGVPSVAITSESSSEIKTQLIDEFKDNQYAVAFTVDIFNEGIDVPNVQALLFLRPTESKTVFMQQLGRGLRLSVNKSEVKILDFIGNYKRANQVRNYLSISKSEKRKQNGAYEKMVYHYNPKCKIYFDETIEQLLDLQDEESRDITREDLIDAYYTLAEELKRKPNKDDIDNYGKYKVSRYVQVFGGWISFLREINEATESSYHYPQGLHLGHMLYILRVLSTDNVDDSYLSHKYVRMRGGLAQDRLGTFQRQTKYKVQGLMEMGILVDDRDLQEEQAIALSHLGNEMVKILDPLLEEIDLSFKVKGEFSSWEMNTSTNVFVKSIKEYLITDSEKMSKYRDIMLNMDAVRQLLEFLYFEVRKDAISKNDIYKFFFKSITVQEYCDRNGIEPPTEEGARHRIPYLLSILESMDIIETTNSNVQVKIFLSYPELYTSKTFDNKKSQEEIARKVINDNKSITENELLELREKFGKTFLTDDYFLKERVLQRREIYNG